MFGFFIAFAVPSAVSTTAATAAASAVATVFVFIVAVGGGVLSVVAWCISIRCTLDAPGHYEQPILKNGAEHKSEVRTA